MIQFDRLRITGFKSFADRTELDIGSGLNGVVGPNGCGKSNLVEAMRWVMGETSAKRMRGGGMEDVIFNGTNKRTARNIAEVSLLLDNSARTAPAAYNSSDEIEVTRRIERDHGSQYKINGKNARARDVQLLFADTVTGANSPAMVSQGRITQIINAKPLERRLVLEDSAGISGLFARRHEAELRLRAADTNLLRLDDLLGGMEERLSALKRQARQATRYRNVNTQIRQMDVLIAYLEWTTLQAKQKDVKERFNAAESIAAEKMITVTQLTKTQNTQSEDLAPLRKGEADAAAALQTQKIALQRIEDEKDRLEQALSEAKDNLARTQRDFEHETQSLRQSSEALERLKTEQDTLLSEEDEQDDSLEEKKALVHELEGKVTKLEEDYNTLIQGEADVKARKQALEDQIKQNTERLDVLNERKDKAQDDLGALEGSSDKDTKEQDILDKINALEDKVKAFQKTVSDQHSKIETLNDGIETARTDLSAAQGKHSEFTAEIAMLEQFFANMQDDDFQPVLDAVQAQSGFEKALSRALGDSLLASLDDDAPTLWLPRSDIMSSLPALPDGVKALLPVVDAPEELHPALSQIGLVDNEEDGLKMSKTLKPGQALVSVTGTYWRWDGYCIKAEAPDRQAIHLEQKTKLAELQKQRPTIESRAEKAQVQLDKLITEQKEAQDKRGQAQNDMRAAENEMITLRSDLSKLREENARYDSECHRLKDVIATAQDDIATLTEVLGWDKERLEKIIASEDDSDDGCSDTLRQTLNEAREALQNALRSFDMLQQKKNSRAARLRAIADERVSLQNQSIRARERLKELEERQTQLTEKVENLTEQPSRFDEQHEELLSKISALETARSAAAEKLAVCESELSETIKALKTAQDALLSAKEERAAAQATMAGLQENLTEMESKIASQFELQAHELSAHLHIAPEQAQEENLDTSKTKRDKLMRERDNIGPVNLRADEEAAELEKEVTGILNERNDLTQAIEELRSGIQKINKEARERLKVAFEHVNAHFKALFTRLYGGGQAHLALVDSDDPLESGLEIYAQPPGKSLQSLSLLSGGEQTLASIALIFAMFLTNPSPICVLDEIDAPLDDANVDRVCDLLDDIAARGQTRFVIITHHRLSMARMDRLYGVTMAERGISQLVSVDLQKSFEFLDEDAA